ncbi:MAG TPA: ATP-binding protein [Gemmataceae bacterium]|jgi:signal transduction histidine kinase
MSQSGTLPAALAILPQWWQEAADASALEATLAIWVRAGGWRAGGFIWPAEAPTVAKTAPNAAAEPLPASELSEVVRRVRTNEPTAVVSLPSGGSRVYAPVTCPGRSLGLVWAERTANQSWSDAERAYMALVGKTLERSPVVAAAIGPAIDPDALAQRLMDAGAIAGRMAHDFDNILTGILGFAELAVPLLPLGSQAASYIAEIAKGGQRGIAFTQQLHLFNRSGESKPTPGSVVATLGREEARLRPAMHAALRLEKDVPAGLPAVAVDAGPLQLALGHLFENAVEACPKGGTVRIAAGPVELTEAEARGYIGKVSPGSHLLIAFTDNGTGIKPEVRKKLFVQPFHTTKVRHRGLGLAIVYRIVAAHRGGLQIDAVPAPGTGTSVRVVLPLVAARPSVAVPTPPPAAQSGLREDAVRNVAFNAATARG